MLERDIRQLGRVIRQGVQTQPHAGKHQAALIAALAGDIGNGGGGAHVDHNDGCGVLVQRRHRACHQVGAQLVVDLHADVEPGFHAGSHDHRGLTQKPCQSLGHHEVDGRHHAGKDGPADVLQVVAIQGKDVHQIDADLIRRFAAVGVDGGQEFQIPLFVEQSHRDIGIADINGQQHSSSPPFRFLSLYHVGPALATQKKRDSDPRRPHGVIFPPGRHIPSRR